MAIGLPTRSRIRFVEHHLRLVLRRTRAMPHLKSSLVVLSVSILILTHRANADLIGGVNFGSAGPSNWGVLELGGSGAAGFGASGATVSINGPNAGIYGTATQANIGIADAGRAN